MSNTDNGLLGLLDGAFNDESPINRSHKASRSTVRNLVIGFRGGLTSPSIELQGSGATFNFAGFNVGALSKSGADMQVGRDRQDTALAD